MAVNGNITSLYETPFDGKLMAASKDILDKNKPDDKNPNINSGMLLLNMKELSKTDLLEKTIALMNSKLYLTPDQTALNKIFKNKIKYVSYKYNWQNRKGPLPKDVVIRHYNGIFVWFPYPHFFHGLPTDDNLKRFYRQRKEHDFDDAEYPIPDGFYIPLNGFSDSYILFAWKKEKVLLIDKSYLKDESNKILDCDHTWTKIDITEEDWSDKLKSALAYRG